MHERTSCIFDVDGVLIDSVAINWRAINQALEPYGVRVGDREIARVKELNTQPLVLA